MSDPDEVVAFLLERRLVSRASIVSGQLEVVDASSRNRNFRVTAGPAASYLLKQGVADDGAATVANEAAVYRHLSAGEPALVACIPRVHGYDSRRGILTVEWVQGGLDLHRYHARRTRCSGTLAAALGRTLATVHAVGAGDDDDGFRRDPPWVLSLHRLELDALRVLSAASMRLIALIQRDERFVHALDELRDGWRASTLVHRDLKWTNCIAYAARGSGRRTRVKLVDWEMAGWGDPAHDVGSAFADYLDFWLRSVPVDGGLDADERVERATRPLSAVQPAIRRFWRSYVIERRLDGPAASRFLTRAVCHAAARLVQNSYEHTQESPQITGRVAYGLQLSRNILLAPDEAAACLLGIPR